MLCSDCGIQKLKFYYSKLAGSRDVLFHVSQFQLLLYFLGQRYQTSAFIKGFWNITLRGRHGNKSATLNISVVLKSEHISYKHHTLKSILCHQGILVMFSSTVSFC